MYGKQQEIKYGINSGKSPRIYLLRQEGPDSPSFSGFRYSR
jgi:hypothetical protein